MKITAIESAPAVNTGATMMEWMKLRILGKRANGVVYLVKIIKLEPLILAVKSCPSPRPSLQKEYKILQLLFGCPNIVHCYGEILSVDRGVEYHKLFLDYAPGGDLMNLIKEYGGEIPESDVRCYTKIILEGFCDIHERGYVHCDIKPGNILVYDPSYQSGSLGTLKIGDFGSAKESGDVDHVPVRRFHGIAYYMSPESVKHGQTTASLDILLLGCVVAEMMTGERPWQSITHIVDLVEKIAFSRDLPGMPQHMSNVGKDFLMRCSARDPRERWTTRRLMTHPFLFPQSMVLNKILLPHKWMHQSSEDLQK